MSSDLSRERKLELLTREYRTLALRIIHDGHGNEDSVVIKPSALRPREELMRTHSTPSFISPARTPLSAVDFALLPYVSRDHSGGSQASAAAERIANSEALLALRFKHPPSAIGNSSRTETNERPPPFLHPQDHAAAAVSSHPCRPFPSDPNHQDGLPFPAAGGAGNGRPS